MSLSFESSLILQIWLDGIDTILRSTKVKKIRLLKYC